MSLHLLRLLFCFEQFLWTILFSLALSHPPKTYSIPFSTIIIYDSIDINDVRCDLLVYLWNFVCITWTATSDCFTLSDFDTSVFDTFLNFFCYTEATDVQDPHHEPASVGILRMHLLRCRLNEVISFFVN